MPTYEYVCPNCGARFEIWQKMSDDPLTTCRTCGGAIHRVLYPAGIVFKGGGFYSTDNRHEDTTKASTPAAAGKTDTAGSSSSGGATDATGSGSASSGESKPAAAAPKD